MHRAQEIYSYSARHLMRVYPGGLRVDSSNYNPAEAWTLGASFAALNWQNWDKPLWINQAMVGAGGELMPGPTNMSGITRWWWCTGGPQG
jgi:hypothetical protein